MSEQLFSRSQCLTKEETSQDKETQENERGGHEGFRKMSVSQASAFLHLPMDFKKEFNETIGYS